MTIATPLNEDEIFQRVAGHIALEVFLQTENKFRP